MHPLCAPWVALATLAAAGFAPAVHSQTTAPSPVRSPAMVSADAPAHAPALTLAQAISLALQHSPTLRAAEFEAQASEGATRQAQARPNPELQTLLEDTRPETRTTTWQLSQPIELGGKRAARVSAAQRAQAQASVALQERRAQVRADVTEAFFDAAIAQERVRLAQASSTLAERASQAVAKRVQAGKVSPVEDTRAQVARAAVAVELLQARSDLRVAQQALLALLGQPQPFSPPALDWQTASDALMAPTTASLEAQAARLNEAPAIRQARLEVDRRGALAELELARRTPDVAITLGTKRSGELGRQQWVMGVAWPLPVWDTNQGNVLQALRLQDKAQAELAATQLRVNQAWRQLAERLISTQAEVQALRQEVLPGAESVWQAAVTGFELGKFNFLETLDAQRTLFQARAQYLRALNDQHRAAANLDRLLGTDGEDAPAATSLKGTP